MSVESLKERMEEFRAGKIGTVNVTGADLSGDPKAAQDEKKGPVTGTVEVDVPEAAKKDVFTDADATADLHQGMTPSFFEDKIDITEEDREAFLQAIMTGGRYEREFSLFGGRLKGVLRCRKIPESDGIISWLSHCVNTRKLDARVEYTTTMRNAVLAAQVKSLRGMISEDFPELPEPYGPVRSDDGKTVLDPGWLGVAEAWNQRPEALVTALHVEIQKFERRYWAMVSDAANQNFWNPAASI